MERRIRRTKKRNKTSKERKKGRRKIFLLYIAASH